MDLAMRAIRIITLGLAGEPHRLGRSQPKPVRGHAQRSGTLALTDRAGHNIFPEQRRGYQGPVVVMSFLFEAGAPPRWIADAGEQARLPVEGVRTAVTAVAGGVPIHKRDQRRVRFAVVEPPVVL